MRCIHTKTGKDAKVGDSVTSFNGDKAAIIDLPKPHKPDSEGFVTVKESGSSYESRFYCSVYGLEWIEREDRS